jgi:hypothetical protein
LLPVLTNSTVNLTSLSLSSNELKAKGADTVAKIIQQNRSLTYLDVSGNDLTNAGAKTVFLALKTNEKLLFLNVSYNEKGLPIARVGLKAINELLLRNRSQLPPDAFQGKLTPLDLASPLSFCSAPNLPTSASGGGPPSPRATTTSANWAPPPTSPRANSGQRSFPTLSNVLAVLKKDSSSTELQPSPSSPRNMSSTNLLSYVPPASSVSLPSKEEIVPEPSTSEKNEIITPPKPTPTTIAFSSSATGCSIGASTSTSRRKKESARIPKIRWNEFTQIFGAVKLTVPLNDTKRTASIRMTDRLTADQITHLAEIANSNVEENEKEDSE